jgi:hypothetical protein
MKMEQTECSKTLALKLQMLVNNPEESIQHLGHGERMSTVMSKSNIMAYVNVSSPFSSWCIVSNFSSVAIVFVSFSFGSYQVM